MDVAFGAVKVAGKPPDRAATRIAVILRQHMHIDAALADFQCGFERVDHARTFGISHAQPVLHDLEALIAFS